jgi:hypothetical protein
MKLLLTLCALVSVFLTTGCQTTQLSKASIYYVPFQFTSTESVTPDSVREKANVIEIRDGRTLAAIEKLLRGASDKAGFDSKRVRMLLMLAPADRSVFVDADGNLLESGKEKHLPSKKFDQLQSIVSEAVSTGGEMK